MIRPQHRGKAVGTMQRMGGGLGRGESALSAAVFRAAGAIGVAGIVLGGILPALGALHPAQRARAGGLQRDQDQGEGTGSHFLEIFSPALLKTTALTSLMITGMMAGYFTMFSGCKTYLKTERGLSVLNTGFYTFVVIAGLSSDTWRQPIVRSPGGARKPSSCLPQARRSSQSCIRRFRSTTR
jgi:hypothetical protein